MKKIVTGFVLFICVFLQFTSVAESIFEEKVLEQGAKIINYDEYAQINTDNGNICVQMAVATDIETGIKNYAIKLIKSDNDLNSTQSIVGFIDYDEVKKLIDLLMYIQEHKQELYNNTEVVYMTKNRIQLGLSVKGTERKLFISFNPSEKCYISVDDIDYVIEVLKGSEDFIQNE